MSRFNLIDEKWIPVRFANGTRNELGIGDTLLRSKEIAAIEDPSPLVVAALHRFLSIPQLSNQLTLFDL